jgi:hypothetical protein
MSQDVKFLNLVLFGCTNVCKSLFANCGTESAPLRTVRALSLAEDPVVGRDREPSPARCPANNVVHVTGLTRPYTLPQLKELLGRTGSLQPDGFWIDNIKSHCYVVVKYLFWNYDSLARL